MDRLWVQWILDRTHDWVTYSAHSIYLDTLLSLGFVGLALLVVALMISARRGIVAFRRSADNTPAALTGLLLLMCVEGLLSSLVITATFTTFVLFSLMLYLSFTQSGSDRIPHPTREPSRNGLHRPQSSKIHSRSSAVTL